MCASVVLCAWRPGWYLRTMLLPDDMWMFMACAMAWVLLFGSHVAFQMLGLCCGWKLCWCPWTQMHQRVFFLIFKICISNVIPFSRSPLWKSPIPFTSPWLFKGAPHPFWPSHPAFPYTEASNPLRSKGRPSHWCPTRPSSATYATRALGPYMCILWLMVQSPGDLRESGQLTLLFLTMGLQTFSALLQSLLHLLHQGPHAQSNGCLRASGSVFVKPW